MVINIRTKPIIRMDIFQMKNYPSWESNPRHLAYTINDLSIQLLGPTTGRHIHSYNLFWQQHLVYHVDSSTEYTVGNWTALNDGYVYTLHYFSFYHIIIDKYIRRIRLFRVKNVNTAFIACSILCWALSDNRPDATVKRLPEWNV